MPSTAALDAAHRCADPSGSLDVEGQMLAAICGAFHIPVGTFNHLTVTPDRIDPRVQTSAEVRADVIPRMVPGIRDHPLFELLPSCRDVLRMSDVVPHRHWVRHPLYSDIIGPAGIPAHSVLIPIDVDSGFTFVMLNRDTDFSDDEVRDLTFLQGVMTAIRLRESLHRESLRREILHRESLHHAPEPDDSPLTRREHEVLVLLDAGLTVTAIARRLVIRPRTAAKHIESIHKTLGTADRLSTVRRAAKAGWLATPR